MGELVFPSQIRFIHDTIANAFQDGGCLDDVIEDLCCGKIDVEAFPTMEVVEIDGNLYTFGNRRLYVFRVAQYRGEIERVPIEIVPSKRLKSQKFTTTNGGRTIEVRGEETEPHCKRRWLKSKSPDSGGHSLEEILEALQNMGLSDSDDDDETDSDSDNQGQSYWNRRK